MSNSLRPYESQHTRPSCPSPTPEVHPNSNPSSQWCHPAISSSVVPFSSCPQSLPASGSFPMSPVFSNESALCIRWPKYWSFGFSISPSKEYSGLISFRINWFDLLAVQGNLQGSPPAPQFESINSLALSLLYGKTIALKSLQMVTAAMKLKDNSALRENYDQPRQHVKKQRHHFADKCPYCQNYSFSSSHVWMRELDYKESWALKNWCFWTVVLEKTL